MAENFHPLCNTRRQMHVGFERAASQSVARPNRDARSSLEFGRIENYIVQNPVRAGLVQVAEEYPWSSASKWGGLKPAAG